MLFHEIASSPVFIGILAMTRALIYPVPLPIRDNHASTVNYWPECTHRNPGEGVKGVYRLSWVVYRLSWVVYRSSWVVFTQI
jgi:hypothetical protein